MPEPLRIACTVSGGGRTAANLQDRIEAGTLPAEIALVLADRECEAIPRLRARGLEVVLEPWARGATAEEYARRAWPRIDASGAGLVCHCGFLRLLLVPPSWRGRVLNIHPGLLPDFGGKGMYGDRVHAAVLAAGARESGCTVHFADDEYDRGPIVLQRRVPVLPGDTVRTLAARVFAAECEAYPEAISLYARGKVRLVDGRVIRERDEST